VKRSTRLRGVVTRLFSHSLALRGGPQEAKEAVSQAGRPLEGFQHLGVQVGWAFLVQGRELIGVSD